jgi:hypothetical protein
VSVFKRWSRIFAGHDPVYGPEPVTVIRDERLRYPHSVAFTPGTNQIVVTSAGANYFSVYEPRRGLRTRWAQSPLLLRTVNDEEAFRQINAQTKLKGGPKGVASHADTVAVYSPEFGVKIYAFGKALDQGGLEAA